MHAQLDQVYNNNIIIIFMPCMYNTIVTTYALPVSSCTMSCTMHEILIAGACTLMIIL